MNVRLLVDGIVRQTTILIAQLSTTAGVRAPLAHVADQVFLDLAREIEGQGVSRKVVADMFGLAIRSYQKKVRRLTAGSTDFLRVTMSVPASADNTFQGKNSSIKFSFDAAIRAATSK